VDASCSAGTKMLAHNKRTIIESKLERVCDFIIDAAPAPAGCCSFHCS